MKPSRIQAVDHVHLEAHPGHADDLRWFYSTVGALEEVGQPLPGVDALTFQSAWIELRICLAPAPRVDPARRRLTLAIPTLEDAANLLGERNYRYVWEHALERSHRRIRLHDPAGHLVELKQEWPFGPL